MRHLLKIGLVANVFEWYEFTVYAYLADIIGQLFFGTENSGGRLIKVFGIFAIGYLARPLGSLFFGVIGDRVGRSMPLKMSLMMMAVPTVLIGCLPTYHSIGLLAPILLLILRCIQGVAMGAELPLNGCYLFEASSANHKSILCSIATASMNIGVLLASLAAFLLFSVFDRQTVLAWAWRIPFLFGLPMTVAISIMRHAIREPPLQFKDRSDSASYALTHPMIHVIPLVSWLTTFGFVLVVWMPSYLIHFLDYPPSLARLVHTLMLIALIPFGLAAGVIAHFWGYQRLIKLGVVATIILTYLLWIGLQSATFGMALMALLVLAAVLSSVNGIIMETLARQFSHFVRCRGMNIAYTFPVVLLGSTTPLICTWIIQKTGLLTFPAFYIMFFGTLALPAAWRLKPVEAL